LRKALEDCSSEKQICVNKRFKVDKIVWVAKKNELRGEGPISKKGPESELPEEAFAPLSVTPLVAEKLEKFPK